LAVIFIVILYCVVGIRSASLNDVAIYGRNILLAPFCLLFGLFLGFGGDDNKCLNAMIPVFIFVAAYGYMELVFRPSFYHWWGMDSFFLRSDAGKEVIRARYFTGFESWFSAQDRLLFNDPVLNSSGRTAQRTFGPAGHPISFAYSLVLTSVPLLIRWPLFTFLVQLPLQFGANSKGALLVLVFACSVLLSHRYFLRRSLLESIWLLVVPWIGVLTLGIIAGLSHGDFHVLGLAGGMKALLAQPFGHGVGTSGNLSNAGWQSTDFIAAQTLGLNRGVESAFAVIIDQIGIPSVLYFALLIAVVIRLIVCRRRDSLLLAAVGVGILSNSVLQEEALFSPSSSGLFFMMAGCFLAARADGGQGEVMLENWRRVWV
jgi:hypothetical protein